MCWCIFNVFSPVKLIKYMKTSHYVLLPLRVGFCLFVCLVFCLWVELKNLFIACSSWVLLANKQTKNNVFCIHYT